MSDGKRNSPMYQEMAIDLTNLLENRFLIGVEVKNKITNLTKKYRNVKKEQGRTGASPPTWPFYNSIDKFMGKINILKRLVFICAKFF
jgi:hypothetical protein